MKDSRRYKAEKLEIHLTGRYATAAKPFTQVRFRARRDWGFLAEAAPWITACGVMFVGRKRKPHFSDRRARVVV